jgi:hypothetical protein
MHYDIKVPQLPEIPESEKTPLVRLLLEIINQLLETNKQHTEFIKLLEEKIRQQAEIINQQTEIIGLHAEKIIKQQEQIQLLKDEIARLKGNNPKPRIKPSKMNEFADEKNGEFIEKDKPGTGKRKKRKKRLTIHEVKVLKPENLPKGSKLLEYKDYIVQSIILTPFNIKFRRGIWETPSGEIIRASLPQHVKGHFDFSLKCFILYLYFQLHVTQPLILESLLDLGFDISSGQINRILTEDKESFHTEMDAVLSIGLKLSKKINTDDTGARHDGKNGYCTYIGNEFFSYFKTTESKSRINFLEILRHTYKDYVINNFALEYMKTQGFPSEKFVLFERSKDSIFSNKDEWAFFLKKIGIASERHIKTATEGALLGSIISHGISKDLAIISDDAGQFNILIHGLCWIHAERKINTLIPINDNQTLLIDYIRNRFWNLYADLKSYKQNPNCDDKKKLKARFDSIFTTNTGYAQLDKVLESLHKNKKELLLVLDRPDIPLHNNSSETEIRDEVKKRKISAGTRSPNGRLSRNTFLSLKKTCKKLGISFYKYLLARFSNETNIPYLPDLIYMKLSGET